MLQRIDMVAMYVHDWLSALEWYQDKLGFSPTYARLTTVSPCLVSREAVPSCILSATTLGISTGGTAARQMLRSTTSTALSRSCGIEESASSRSWTTLTTGTAWRGWPIRRATS
jgi:hypothetical protein